MKEKLEVGDIVNILYNDGRQLFCRVISVAQQTGEMWIFQNLKWDELIYQNPMSTNLDSFVLYKGKLK